MNDLIYIFFNLQNKSPHDELDLAAVVCVKAIPPSKENLSMFHFEVHFTGYKGSPWKMRAYTQVL